MDPFMPSWQIPDDFHSGVVDSRPEGNMNGGTLLGRPVGQQAQRARILYARPSSGFSRARVVYDQNLNRRYEYVARMVSTMEAEHSMRCQLDFLGGY
jgi:hypothetical protein